jgi:hypothetical protein
LNGPDGKGPLASYFKGERMHGGGSDAGLFGTCSSDISLSRYTDDLLQREKYVPRRGSYSLLRDCYKETQRLDVSFCFKLSAPQAKILTDSDTA